MRARITLAVKLFQPHFLVLQRQVENTTVSMCTCRTQQRELLTAVCLPLVWLCTRLLAETPGTKTAKQISARASARRSQFFIPLTDASLRGPTYCSSDLFPLPAALTNGLGFCLSNLLSAWPDGKGGVRWKGKTCQDWSRPGMHGVRKGGHACALLWTHEHHSVSA